MGMSGVHPMYLHLFYFNITWNFACSPPEVHTHSLIHSLVRTPAAPFVSQIPMLSEEKESYSETMYLVFLCCMCERERETRRLRASTKHTRQRKTIENNKEKPLKQHAGPVYIGVCQLWLWNFSVVHRTTHTHKHTKREREKIKRGECKFLLKNACYSFWATMLFCRMHMGSTKIKRFTYAHTESIYC